MNYNYYEDHGDEDLDDQDHDDDYRDDTVDDGAGHDVAKIDQRNSGGTLRQKETRRRQTES